MEIDATREYAAAANSGRTRWEVTGRGGFAGLRVVLQKGAVVRAESDALIVKGPGVTLASEMGNLFQSMARSMLTNESFFLQRLGAELDDCEVLLGGPPGDIFLLQVGRGGAEYMLTSGAFLASDEDVQIGSEMHSNPLQGLFAGTGLFIMRAGGPGTVAVTCDGSMVHYKLRGGATMSVDNGHLVAWTAGMKYWVGMSPPGPSCRRWPAARASWCTSPGPATCTSRRRSWRAATAARGRARASPRRGMPPVRASCASSARSCSPCSGCSFSLSSKTLVFFAGAAVHQSTSRGTTDLAGGSVQYSIAIVII